MTPPQIGSVCSGYGGLEMGLRDVLPTAELAWVADHEPPTQKNPNPRQGAARILAHRFPDIPNLGDITTTRWADTAPVDIVSGGTPCQDMSHAGPRIGMRTGTRSGLWSSMADAIAHHRPTLVVWENVRGALSAEADSNVEPCPICVGDQRDAHLRALGRVLGDLADLGYDTVWCGLRAADIGAPHGRYRVFVLGWPAPGDANRGDSHRRTPAGLEGKARSSDRLAADADGSRPQGTQPAGRRIVPDRCAVASEWGEFTSAIRRWESTLGRPAPDPTEPGLKGGQRLSPGFVEWLMGLPHGWVTDVPGLTRNDQLHALGNGVVPQQAAAAIHHVLRYAPAGTRHRLGLPTHTAPLLPLEVTP